MSLFKNLYYILSFSKKKEKVYKFQSSFVNNIKVQDKVKLLGEYPEQI